MKSKLFVVLFVCFANLGFAQFEKPDTLIIKLNDYAKLSICSIDLLNSKKQDFSLDSVFINFYNEFSIIKNKIDIENSIVVNCNLANNKIMDFKLSEVDKKLKEIVIQDGYSYEFKEYNYILKFNNLDRLNNNFVIEIDSKENIKNVLNLNLDSLYNNALNDFRSKKTLKRSCYKLIYESENNILNTKNSFFKQSESNDMFAMTINANLNIINSKIIPELNFGYSVIINHKKYLEQTFGLNYSILIFPNDNIFSQYHYDFIGLSCSFRNLNYNYKLGASLDYNFQSTGNLFNNKTFRLKLDFGTKNLTTSIGSIYVYRGEKGNMFDKIPVFGFGFNF